MEMFVVFFGLYIGWVRLNLIIDIYFILLNNGFIFYWLRVYFVWMIIFYWKMDILKIFIFLFFINNLNRLFDIL